MIGVVENISKRGKAFNALIGGKWYGCGFNAPPFSVNDKVSFDISVNGQWENIIPETVEVIANNAAPRPTAAPKANVSKVQAGSKEAFYADRDAKKAEQDAARQKEIRYQASRNQAISFVDLLLRVEGLKLPVKAANKEETLLEAVEYYAGIFNQRTASYMGEAVEQHAVPSEVVDEVEHEDD